MEATLDSLNLPGTPVHLAIGMFDGVHLGHQAVIEPAIHSARRCRGLAAVLTFDPHPSRLFRPDQPTRLLQPRLEKVRILTEMGVDLVIFQPFDRAFAAVEAEAFPGYLVQRVAGLSALYVGENFRFGRGRSGDVGQLIQASRPLGLVVYSVERIRENGEPISSTRIRAALEAGEITKVNRLLGHTYRSCGVIEAGRQLGTRLGFPTVNAVWVPELAPAFGVYVVRARVNRSGDWVPGVANYGVRPTVAGGDGRPCLEVHALETVAWGPGETLEVEWLKWLRAEQRFEDLTALKAQIGKDRAAAEAFFK